MTAKEWWAGLKGLRPSWQLVVATIVIGLISPAVLLVWLALWALTIIWHFLFNPKLKAEVQKMLRLEEEQKAAQQQKRDDAGGP